MARDNNNVAIIERIVERSKSTRVRIFRVFIRSFKRDVYYLYRPSTNGNKNKTGSDSIFFFFLPLNDETSGCLKFLRFMTETIYEHPPLSILMSTDFTNSWILYLWRGPYRSQSRWIITTLTNWFEARVCSYARLNHDHLIDRKWNILILGRIKMCTRYWVGN